MLVLWVHKARTLSSMMALRESASISAACLTRNLRYVFAKLKTGGRLRSSFQLCYATPPVHPSGASTTNVAMSPRHTAAIDPSTLTNTGWKRHGSEVDPDHNAQNHPRRVGNLVEEVPRIPIGFRHGVPMSLH